MKRIYILGCILFISMGCFLGGCQGDSFEIDNEINESLSGYLSLPSGFDISKLSDEESKIFYNAFTRMSVYYEDGIYKTKFSSGNQINISEELFDHFNKVLNNSNQVKDIKLLSPRLKSGDESSYENDCVAHSIHYVLSQYNSSPGFSSIKMTLQNIYGANGVPNGSYYDALRLYLKGSPTSVANGFIRSNGKYVLAVIQPTNAPAHSVEIQIVSNGMAYFYDTTTGNDGMIELSKVSLAFEVTGKK